MSLFLRFLQNFFLLSLLGLQLYLKPQTALGSQDSGRQLFQKRCLICHSDQGTANQYDFTNSVRIYGVKNALIASIRDNSMPPAQILNDSSCYTYNYFNQVITSNEKEKIILWLNTLEEKSADKLTPIKENLRILKSNNDYSLTIEEKDLQLIRKHSAPGGVRLFYLLKKALPFPMSITGVAIGGDLNKKPHHIIMAYRYNPKHTLFVWGKVSHLDVDRFPGDISIGVTNKEIILDVHYSNIDRIKSLKNSLRILLFYKKASSPTQFYFVGLNNWSPIPNYSYTGFVSQTFKNNLNKSFYIKMIAPHTHSFGVQFFAERLPAFSPEKTQCIHSGYNPSTTKHYALREPLLIKKNDSINFSCYYKNSKVPINLSSLDQAGEMCSLFFSAE